MPLRPMALFLLLAVPALAQKVEVNAGVQPRECVLGESASYIVAVKVSAASEEALIDPPQPAPPSGTGYSLEFADVNHRDESQFFFFNGQRRGQIARTSRFVFALQPARVGTLVVPGFDYEVAGRRYRIPESRLSVTAEAPGNQYVSVSVAASNPTPYVNQPIELTYELSTTKTLVRPLPELTIPWATTPNGFYAEPAEELSARSDQTVPVSLNERDSQVHAARSGREGYRLTLERTVYPLAPGRLEIGGTTSKVHVATRFRRGFFGTNPDNSIKALVNTAPLVFDVRDAPAVGRPASYTGIIGDFVVDARLGDTTIKAGDGVTLSLSLRGRGALDGLQPPELKGFDDFDVYPPDRDVTGEGSAREMTFSWLLVPKSTEVDEVPRFSFSWFRPSSESFETVSVGPKKLTIEGEIKNEGIFESSATAREAAEIRTLGEGVRPIKDAPGSLSRAGRGVPTAWFLIIALAPVASFVLLSVVAQRRRRLQGDERLVRRRRASKQAVARLQEARALLDGGARGFHGRLARSLSGFIGDKLGVPPASVSAATARELLGRAGLRSETVEEVASAFDELDAKEFGGAGGSESERRADLERVEGLIHVLDKAIRS